MAGAGGRLSGKPGRKVVAGVAVLDDVEDDEDEDEASVRLPLLDTRCCCCLAASPPTLAAATTAGLYMLATAAAAAAAAATAATFASAAIEASNSSCAVLAEYSSLIHRRYSMTSCVMRMIRPRMLEKR